METTTPIRGGTMKEEKFQELVSRFTNHIPDSETLLKMKEIRTIVRKLSYLIEKNCPESREKATALTQLSFVMMSANSAIVQKSPVNKDDLEEWEK
jgi:hypothetical protein